MLCFPSVSSSRIASVRLRVLLYQNCSFPPSSCAFSRSALACPWFFSRLANTASKYKHLDTSDGALSSQEERYGMYNLLLIFQTKLMNRHRSKNEWHFLNYLQHFLVNPYITLFFFFQKDEVSASYQEFQIYKYLQCYFMPVTNYLLVVYKKTNTAHSTDSTRTGNQQEITSRKLSSSLTSFELFSVYYAKFMF